MFMTACDHASRPLPVLLPLSGVPSHSFSLADSHSSRGSSTPRTLSWTLRPTVGVPQHAAIIANVIPIVMLVCLTKTDTHRMRKPSGGDPWQQALAQNQNQDSQQDCGTDSDFPVR